MRFLLILTCSLYAVGQSDPAQALFEKGETALAQGNYGEAQAAYEQLVKVAPSVAEAHAKLGLIYFQQGKFDRAVPVLKQAIKLKPSLPNTDVLLAMSLSETGRFNEALPGLEKGFRRSSNEALKRMAGLQLQRTYTGLKKDDQAVEVALELCRLYPQDAEVLYHSGKLFGNFAYLTMRRLAEVAPTSTWRHLAAGEAYESQGSYDLAGIEYAEVLKADANRPGVHFRLGRVLLAQSQGSRAAEEFEAELKLDSTNANAAYELAEISRKAGDLDKAQKLFAAAINYDSQFSEAYVGLGKVFLAQGKPNQALTPLQKSVALDSENAVAYFQLAKAQQALGNVAEQQKSLEAYRRLHRERTQQERKDLFAQDQVTRQDEQ